MDTKNLEEWLEEGYKPFAVTVNEGYEQVWLKKEV